MVEHSEVMPVFDRPHATALAEAKKEFLNKLLPELRELGLRTALDAGCGLGYFAGYLQDSGFKVTAFDARPENIAEAKKRNPDVRFLLRDVEDCSTSTLGSHDVVLCLGLLYHLENPFRAMRNLAAITKKVLVIETMIAPARSPMTILSEEWPGQDQALSYLALIPSESCLVKMLYRVGFSLVYQCSLLPEHKDFHASLLYKRRRTVLVASKTELQHPMLNLLRESRQLNRFHWYRFGLGGVLENERLMRMVKSVRSFFHSREG